MLVLGIIIQDDTLCSKCLYLILRHLSCLLVNLFNCPIFIALFVLYLIYLYSYVLFGIATGVCVCMNVLCVEF